MKTLRLSLLVATAAVCIPAFGIPEEKPGIGARVKGALVIASEVTLCSAQIAAPLVPAIIAIIHSISIHNLAIQTDLKYMQIVTKACADIKPTTAEIAVIKQNLQQVMGDVEAKMLNNCIKNSLVQTYQQVMSNLDEASLLAIDFVKEHKLATGLVVGGLVLAGLAYKYVTLKKLINLQLKARLLVA
jgi:hypothetical protein